MSIRSKILRGPFSFLYKVAVKWVEVSCGISIPYNMPIGRRVCFEHFGGIILVARSIGNDVTIRQNTTFGLVHKDNPGWPTIGNNVDIGAGAVIVGDIDIGENSLIGANAVVLKSVPANSIAVGVPAVVRSKTQ